MDKVSSGKTKKSKNQIKLKSISLNDKFDIVTKINRGKSQAAVAKEKGLNRQTVNNYRFFCITQCLTMVTHS